MNKHISQMWKIFSIKDSSIKELRALWPKGISPLKPTIIKHFRVRSYDTVEECKSAFEADALRLNGLGYNIYTVMNPIKACINGKAVKDADISHRNLLLIDIDRKGDASCPASDEELNSTGSLAASVREFLADEDWPDPIKVMSGNGWHLYYAMDDLDNDKKTTELIKQTLNNLARRFDNSIAGVDTSVSNASRITKVPGTIMHKGQESEGRPYRMAIVHE